MIESTEYKKIVKLSPSISTENIGDHIIKYYCDLALEEIFPNHFSVYVPTVDKLSRPSMRHIASADYAFVCGTNLLSSHMNKEKQWNVSREDLFKLARCDLRRREYFRFDKVANNMEKNSVCLMGVGWWQYQDEINSYTEKLLKKLLNHSLLHSVRDSYTENKLKSIGIKNVVNTACPTMWGLTPELCSRIPKSKGRDVVTTLTHYNRNSAYDRCLLEILIRHYNNVYVWLQAIEDYPILLDTGLLDRVKIIPPNMQSYDQLLQHESLDYVGTRLHGGIHALNNRHRSIILAVDNRAVEIGRDTNLPVIKRDKIDGILEDMIEKQFATEIILPSSNIELWKQQFS